MNISQEVNYSMIRKLTWTICILSLFVSECLGTTWSAAYPYTQKMDGQQVVVKAIPYAPYSGSPMFGVTRVYYEKKLLYTIHKYFREELVTSDDGQYLAVIHSSNSLGVQSYTRTRFKGLELEQLDFNQPAIEIFKDGLPYKTFSLKDVADTSKLASNGDFFNWGYYFDFEAYDRAEDDCRSCVEDYGKKALRTRDTSEMDLDEWEACKRACDSAKHRNPELAIYLNSIYVQDNILFVLTNQNTVVKLDFVTMTLLRIPLDSIIPDKRNFNPPKINRHYKRVKLPEHSDEPDLTDGRSFEKGVADIFGLSVSNAEEKETFCVFINYLILDLHGKYIDFYGKVYDRRISEQFSQESVNTEMTTKLNQWAKEQTFETKLIPKGFDGFSFLCIVYLK